MNQEQITSILRQILLVLGGSLVTKGYIDAATLNSIIGAVLILGGSFWAIYSRRQAGILASAADIPGTSIQVKDQALANSLPANVTGPTG